MVNIQANHKYVLRVEGKTEVGWKPQNGRANCRIWHSLPYFHPWVPTSSYAIFIPASRCNF